MLAFKEYLREMKFYSNEVNEMAISKASEYDFGKYGWFHLSTTFKTNNPNFVEIDYKPVVD